MNVHLVFDLETLLIDIAAGIRHALNHVARKHGSVRQRPLSHEQLRARALDDILAGIAGSDEPELIEHMLHDYRQVYLDDSRFRTRLLPGAAALVQRLVDGGAELHYVATCGPETATRLVREHGLARWLATVYTPPQPIPPCARAGLFANFIAGRELPAGRHRLLSDDLSELQTAKRLGVPALALGYSATAPAALAAAPGVTGVASSPADVGRWLAAEAAARECLDRSGRRFGAEQR